MTPSPPHPVMAGPVPAISIGKAPCHSDRDHRHKAGDDKQGVISPVPWTGRSEAEGRDAVLQNGIHTTASGGTSVSLPLVGGARVGVLAPDLHRLSHTPPPPPPSHKGEESWASTVLHP
jgi:hypothetical protein